MRNYWFVGCFVAMTATACERAPAAAAETPAVVGSARMVAKVVFIDQAEACECTQKRIEVSWRALQTALAARPGMKVERIHLDTQAAQAQVYTALTPLMVTPGIYLVDVGDSVIDVLQGEVQAEQVTAALAKTK